MEIKCKATGRFLMNLKIEDYYKQIKKLGLDIQTSFTIEVPCPKCKMVEVYVISAKGCEHISSYKNVNIKRIDNKNKSML